MLQSFIQSMLPKHAESVFGRGTAGEIWKSFLAERLAAEIARSGKVGIAERIATGGASGPTPPAATRARTIPDLTQPLGPRVDDGQALSSAGPSKPERG